MACKKNKFLLVWFISPFTARDSSTAWYPSKVWPAKRPKSTSFHTILGHLWQFREKPGPKKTWLIKNSHLNCQWVFLYLFLYLPSWDTLNISGYFRIFLDISEYFWIFLVQFNHRHLWSATGGHLIPSLLAVTAEEVVAIVAFCAVAILLGRWRSDSDSHTLDTMYHLVMTNIAIRKP